MKGRFTATVPGMFRVWDPQAHGWLSPGDSDKVDPLLPDAYWWPESLLQADGIDDAEEGRYQIYPVRESDL
jgi:hypothetical protein